MRICFELADKGHLLTIQGGTSVHLTIRPFNLARRCLVDQTRRASASTQIVMLLILVIRFLELVVILNRIVMMLRRGHIAWSLRIESIHRVLRVDSLDCIRGIWRVDKGLRAYCAGLNHRLVEVL